jgi:Tfp pilus tip-associated adhesin PilY1
MNISRPRLGSLLAAAGLAGVLALPGLVQAQEALPAVLPDVVFLIEDSARMGDNWDGDSTLTGPDARWVYVKDAVAQVIQNAPVGMTFGVALTADGTNDSVDLESDFGFEPLASPGSSAANIIAAMDAHVTSSSGERTYAESFSSLLDTWAEENWATPRNWQGGPFQYSCSQLVVIMIGSNIGQSDANPSSGYYTVSPALDVQCNDSGGSQGCFADNVAHFAYYGFNAPLAGSGAVSTYTLLIDANSPSIEVDAAPLFQSTANFGQGLFYSAAVPGAIQTAIWGMLTDTFSGTYSNAAISMTPSGDTMFGSFFEVEGGHPLYKGHLLAWDIDTDPTSVTYGQVIAGTGDYGEAWDAGLLLNSRPADPSEGNQPGWDPMQQRVGFTAYEPMTFMSTLQPFDETSVNADTDDLTQLLVDLVPATANHDCNPLAHDYDYDCDSDHDDAQVLVDFIRGVSTATFLHTGLPRDTWKMGDTGHSIAVAAPSSVSALSTENHFYAYASRLGTYPGMVYVASNAGMLHAFNLDNAPDNHRGEEYWFYVPRMKAHKDPTDTSVREYDGHQIDDLMRSGQTFVNDGKVTIDHVWLDGYLNGLGSAPPEFASGCSGPGYYTAEADGIIDPNGCEWHRVAVWAGGYGARHVYALDVTDPYNPLFLWERTDTNGNTGPGKGRAVGTPALAAFVDRSTSPPERRWIVFWGAGEQSPGITTASTGSLKAHASVFIHDVDTTTARVPFSYAEAGYRATGDTVDHPHASVVSADSDTFQEYDALPAPDASTLAMGLFGSPAMVDLDGDGSVDVAYIGDSLGYLMKTVFDPFSPGSSTRCVFAEPDTTDEAKHLWYRPSVFYSLGGEVQVYYGSGSPHNIYSAEQGGLYVKKDPDPFDCASADVADCAAESTLFNTSGFYKFTGIGEKLVGDPIAVYGRLFFTTHSPGSDACVLGTSRVYGLNVETCGGGIPDVTTDSYSQDSSGLYTEVAGLISAPVFANGRIYALNIDSSGMDANSVMDDLQITPNDQAAFIFTGFRHVY